MSREFDRMFRATIRRDNSAPDDHHPPLLCPYLRLLPKTGRQFLRLVKMAEPLQDTKVIPDTSVIAAPEVASPSPERTSVVWTRRFIILAFWAVVATLGLPHWIWTTSIYRSDLPVEQMTNWSEGSVGLYKASKTSVYFLIPFSGLSTSISHTRCVGSHVSIDRTGARHNQKDRKCVEL